MEKHKERKDQTSKGAEKHFYQASAADFKKIPGSPVAYWVSDNERNLYYNKAELLSEVSFPRKGLDTGENDFFLRFWYEIKENNSCFNGKDHGRRWYPYNKGGDFRRWYGNREYLINWENDGEEIKSRIKRKTKKPTLRNTKFYFREGFSWTTVSSGGFSARYSPEGAIFDNGGCTLFADYYLFKIGGFLNSKVMGRYLEFLSPTLNFQPGDIGRVLFQKKCFKLPDNAELCISVSKLDWDSYETSWDFTVLPLLSPQFYDKITWIIQPAISHLNSVKISEAYNVQRQLWEQMTLEMRRLEEENNRIFIEAYDLQDKLTPDVPLKEITLTCNPYYRYGKKADESLASDDYLVLGDDLEGRLLLDTMREFISYAVGCMFGRYSLDKPGLVLANQGEGLREFFERLDGEPSFIPEEKNVIPILNDDWFANDITERFRKFLRVSFGDEHYEENMRFIQEALGKDIRKYFLKDFYNDHVKRYKKRPIYWLFSSPDGNFNALIYMHRYRSDTVSIVLNEYLREYRNKLCARVESLKQVVVGDNFSKADRAKSEKEITGLKKTISVLDKWEREVVYPLAAERIEIDLDDGVKVNYAKFGSALKKIPGLDAKEV